MPVHGGGKRIESFPPVVSAGAQTLTVTTNAAGRAAAAALNPLGEFS